jgi:hypothetical protein
LFKVTKTCSISNFIFRKSDRAFQWAYLPREN